MLNIQTILQQMDSAIQRGSSIHTGMNNDNPDEVISELNTSMHSVIHRFSPAGSKYLSNADALIAQYSVSNSYVVKLLLGILKSLRADYASGGLSSIQELIHADLSSDT